MEVWNNSIGKGKDNDSKCILLRQDIYILIEY